ncbi:DUF6377 domain-containing protein [Siansivirga zeaxanthinifaciens]|uniref:Transcriptional regulator n=1 Tax=Siansivirga zeaxanthinifaciens CC-SAMT-1 TaxID=1454006 RepID=A0A0C5WNP5_9FLAO|nr:DUF6377 domain-containing protein [Siansivirga zeaxanthinifaciens]AJR04535.1 transcriptional regulator [Siansivirga zeaxanthinifaciens CC-SAMT-1]
MKKLLLFLTSLTLSIQCYGNSNLDSLLLELEVTMRKRAFFDNAKKLRVENLKKLINDKDSSSLQNNYFIINEIINEYEKYSFDKALFYIEKNLQIAKKLNNNKLEKESQLKLAKLLATSGRYKEGIDVLNEIRRNELPEKLLEQYYFNYVEGYSGLSFYTTVQTTKERYSQLYLIYQDSLQQKLDPNSDQALALIEKELRDNRNIVEALRINSKRLSQLKLGTTKYSLVTFERALLYGLNNNARDQKMFLALSAISDITASVKDNASLTELAMILFEEGDIERAYKYIDFSVEDTEIYNSRLRFVNISNKLSVISKAFEEKNLEQQAELKKMLLYISVLALFLLFTILYIYRQIKRLSSARKALKKANIQLTNLNERLSITNSDLNRLYNELSNTDKIKEQYIGTFLNLYSDYINKLDTYRKMVRNYLVSNKTKTLLELTKSKQLVDNELQIFYQNFDKSFLHIYPNFIREVNGLLKPGEQIKLNKDEVLNTELRILALIRLGLTNSSKISKILRYSVNTIYNYRVKIKNSALNRDTFEDDVKKIQ